MTASFSIFFLTTSSIGASDESGSTNNDAGNVKCYLKQLTDDLLGSNPLLREMKERLNEEIETLSARKTELISAFDQESQKLRKLHGITSTDSADSANKMMLGLSKDSFSALQQADTQYLSGALTPRLETAFRKEVANIFSKDPYIQQLVWRGYRRDSEELPHQFGIIAGSKPGEINLVPAEASKTIAGRFVELSLSGKSLEEALVLIQKQFDPYLGPQSIKLAEAILKISDDVKLLTNYDPLFEFLNSKAETDYFWKPLVSIQKATEYRDQIAAQIRNQYGTLLPPKAVNDLAIMGLFDDARIISLKAYHRALRSSGSSKVTPEQLQAYEAEFRKLTKELGISKSVTPDLIILAIDRRMRLLESYEAILLTLFEPENRAKHANYTRLEKLIDLHRGLQDDKTFQEYLDDLREHEKLAYTLQF